MPMYLGTEDAGTSQFSLQDFEPSFGSKMNAAVRESWLESYGPAAADYLGTKFGGASTDPKLSALEAAGLAKEAGVKLRNAPGDGQYNKTQLSVLMDRQRELAAVKDVRERTPWDMGSVLRGGAMFGAGIVDPINLATAFVPWTKSITALNAVRGLATAESLGARTLGRAALGAADGGISTAVLEPAYAAVRDAIGDDYSAADSLANIAFGTAFGGGIHAIGGAGSDAMRALRGRSAVPTPADPTFNPATDAPAPPAGAVPGGMTQIRIGEAYEPARWSVVDADQLTATVDKADNQFRDRSRAAYQTEIQQRANNLDFNLLADSPVMDYGAPTLAKDGRIIGGNGRALFIARGYEIGKGADYRAAMEARLADLGIDPDAMRSMQKPVLVRVLQRDVDVKRAAMLSNEGGSTDMSPLEQAKVDAERLGDTRLEVAGDGNLDAPENRAAIRKWVEAQPENKRNGLLDDDGRLSASGLKRLNDALLFKAYGDSPVLGRLIESMDPGSKNIAQALGRTAPRLANARAAIASGDLHPVDIASDIQLAVEKFNSLREAGTRVPDYLAQLDAFGGGLSPEATELLAFMGRNIGSPRRMADAIAGFYDGLSEAGNPKQSDMFGASVAPDKGALLRAAIEAAERGQDSAADVMAGVSPETREATLRAAVAQAADGREVDIDRIVGLDESRNTATMEDVTQAAERNFEPEQSPLADFEASAAVQSRVDTAPKWEALSDAELALGDADAALTETVRAGQDAFKYSRKQATLPETDKPVKLFFSRNQESSTQFKQAAGADMGQALEPAGEYMNVDRSTQLAAPDARWETGVVAFENPLVLEHKGTDSNGWKKDLSDMFGGKTGKALSKAVRAAGHDGIVTFDKYGLSESVNLSGKKTVGATVLDPSDASPLYARGITGDAAPEFLNTALRQSFGASTDALMQSGRVQVVATAADIPGGPHPMDAKAATAPDGTVYVVAENVSPMEARGILLHEVGVHVGMENMLGREVFDGVLSALDDAITKGEGWAQAARAAVPSDTPAHLVREEQLAYLVQNAPELPIVQRIIAAVRAWAYRSFEFARDRIELGEADFRAMAVAALREAAQGRGVIDGALAFSRDVAQTGTKAFADWFGDSLVREPMTSSKQKLKDMPPKVLYHGTRASFDVFAPVREGNVSTTFGGDSTVTRHGIFFAENPEFANTFAAQAGDGASKVLPVYAAIKNAVYFDESFTDADGNLDELIAAGLSRSDAQAIKNMPQKWAAFDGEIGARLVAAARKAGFDGAFMKEEGVGLGDNADLQDVWVAFDSTQIKSATGNNGQFDPKNPDIRYSRGETPEPPKPEDELKPYNERIARAKQYASVLRAAADKLANDAQATEAMRGALPDITKEEVSDLLDQLRRQVKGLRGVARDARAKLSAEDMANTLQPEAMRAADELANNLELAAVIEKRNAALNLNVRLRATGFLRQFQTNKLDFEGFRALLVGTERKRAGGRVSVELEHKSFRGEWLGGMIADLEKAGLMKGFASGAFDRDAYVALYNIGKGIDNGKLPKEAVQIAEIVSKYQSDARNTRNRFGAWIRDLNGYITRQSHDMFKIRDAGEKAFKDYVMPRLDLAKSMRDFDGNADLFLSRVYDDFASGSHLKTPTGEVEIAALGAGSSLARRESVSRVLYFKDGAAAFEYNEKFGQGRLAESVLSGLDSAAQSAALMKVLGTNPEATVTRLFDEYADSLRGDPERRAKFESKRGEMQNLLAHLDGSANIPGNATAAKIGSFARAWQSMAKLGGMLLSSASDLTNYAAELRFGQDKNLLSGTLDAMGALAQGRSKGEKQAILNSLGVFHESALGAVFARFDAPDLVGGKTAAAMQQFFKLSGINWWTDSLKDGYALAHSAYLASNTGQAFHKLPDALRDMLGLYNIDAGKWDVLRIAATKEADGRMYMTPDGLRTVPAAVLENYITSVNRTPSEAAMANLRADLSGALRAMTIDRMNHAVIEPGTRARAFMLRGTQPGTVPGELLRFVTQFKSFPVAMIQTVLGREVYGRGYDTIGDYLKNGKGDMLGLASFIAMSTMMGYAAMSAKDLLRGKNPRPVDDPRTWMAAMVQGGGLGIYGDFLFGKFNRMGGSLTTSLAGPVFGLADTMADLWTRVRSGDDFAAASFQAAVSNTPFLNLFYIRSALDYLVLFKIQEAMNPGFLRRMEKRVDRENGQTFYLPPSQNAL